MVSRQNPDYPLEDTHRDAMALVTAFLAHDESLEDQALRNALDGTDHTLLTTVLSQLTASMIQLIAVNTAQPVDELLQLLGSMVAEILEDPPDA